MTDRSSEISANVDISDDGGVGNKVNQPSQSLSNDRNGKSASEVVVPPIAIPQEEEKPIEKSVE